MPDLSSRGASSPVCRYQDSCSGCQYLGTPYDLQKQTKIQNLKQHLNSQGVHVLPEPDFLSAREFYLRDRLDFTLTSGRLGLFAKNSRDVVDLELCLQLSPALQEWLNEFRQIRWPMDKASFRLRIGPQGQRGVWIDCANIDIKNLLDEKDILKSLQKKAFVEMGQKRKVPLETATGYKLVNAEVQVWFETWMNDRSIPLFCHVASFTQPSMKANRLIADRLASWMQGLSAPRVLEFGSGIGNLTFPALAFAKSLTACEIDRLSLEGLQKTLHEQNLLSKVRIHAGDFQKKLSEDFADYDLILCNPPRSGLLEFLSPLEKIAAPDRPEYFIYMSCFPESLSVDLARLQKLNYQLQKLAIIDQFPQTKHYEVLCLLERK